MNLSHNQSGISKLILHFVGILLLIAPAFYNGFPLVFSDTGTYILSGMDWMVPDDRPVMYGLFIRLTSLGASLWLVVFWQAVLVYYVLYRFMIAFSEKFRSDGKLAVILVLVVSTGLGWYTSQLMPDIFTAIVLLIIPLLVFHQRTHRIHAFLLSIIFLLSIMVHFSNVLIAFLTLIVMAILSLKTDIMNRKRIGLIVLLTALSVPLTGFINWSVDGSFNMGRGGHVFMMVRVHDSGVLESFLRNECASDQYALCAYKDSLPENSRGLLWNGDSPLYKLGGWQKSKPAFQEVLIGIATHPKYLVMYLYNSALASVTQLFQNDVGSGLVSEWYSNPGSPPAYNVHQFFYHEYKPYQQSRQNKNLWAQGLDFSSLNVVVNWLLIFCSVFLFYVLGRNSMRARIDSKQLIMVWVLISGVVLNAIVTASLANIYDRLQARVSWLIVLVALLVLITNYKIISDQFRKAFNGS